MPEVTGSSLSAELVRLPILRSRFGAHNNSSHGVRFPVASVEEWMPSYRQYKCLGELVATVAVDGSANAGVLTVNLS